jgi:hypothetical protein
MSLNRIAFEPLPSAKAQPFSRRSQHRWLLPYADLMTVLFCLLLGVLQLQQQEIEANHRQIDRLRQAVYAQPVDVSSLSLPSSRSVSQPLTINREPLS